MPFYSFLSTASLIREVRIRDFAVSCLGSGNDSHSRCMNSGNFSNVFQLSVSSPIKRDGEVLNWLSHRLSKNIYGKYSALTLYENKT